MRARVPRPPAKNRGFGPCHVFRHYFERRFRKINSPQSDKRHFLTIWAGLSVTHPACVGTPLASRDRTTSVLLMSLPNRLFTRKGKGLG